nr:hypothetical protein [uncultured Mediterranean phage uvMED]
MLCETREGFLYSSSPLFFFMYFVIWKPKDKFTSFTNVLFTTEKKADEFMKKNKKRKIEFKVVPFDNENYNKYWFK